MKFNLEDYTDEYHAMHCPEEWMAEQFCNFLHEHGRKWCNDESYKEILNYKTYEKDTVYLFNRGMYGSRDVDYITLEFTDFDFSANEPSFTTDNLDAKTIDMFFAQFVAK